MFKKLLFSGLLMVAINHFGFTQAITVSNIVTAGKLNECGGPPPVVTATYISGNGSSVIGGVLTCTDPCDSTVIEFTMSNIRWNKGPDINWIHGVFFPANLGFTFLNTNLSNGPWIATTGCTGINGINPGSCGNNAGTVGAPGFYFAGTSPGCCPGGGGTPSPCDNWGNSTPSCGVPLSFTFKARICNNAFISSLYTLRVKASADGNTGCWTQPDPSVNNNLTWSIAVSPCGPLYAPVPTATTTRDCSTGTPNYTATLTGGCGNGNTVTWWTASSGGTMVGSGSPFVYDPPGSACPGGTTLYSACCTILNGCLNRRAFAIGGTCDVITIDTVYRTNPTCTVPNGSIDSVKTLFASGPVTYTVNPGGLSNTTGAFPNLAPGTYTITAADGSGCTSSSTVTFAAATNCCTAVPTATSTPASCPGINNGTITVTVTPAGAYTYVLDGNAATSNTTGIFTGVAGGPHNVTVSAPGCTVSVSVTVATGPALTGTSTSTNTTCNNATNGTMTATPTAGSGTAPFTYTINATPANTTGALSGMFTGLAAGTYIITFTDANGCQGTTTQTIAAGPALTATASTTAASCPGVNNGTFTVTAPTGTAPFTYTINATPANITGAASGNFTGLPGGSYTVTFTDANGCTGTVTAVVATSAALSGTSTFTNTSCNNATNGTMNATPAAGSGTGPFTYTINATPANTTGATSGAFTGLPAGTYTITFTDANGCTGTTTKTITAGPALTATASTTAASCPGVNTGTFTVTAPTGTAPFTYTINATPANTTGAASGNFTVLPGGSYTVTFTDANGCTGTVTAVVATSAALSGTSTSTNTTCNNATNGTMNATPAAGSGTGPFTYTINATPANTTGATSGAFTGLPAGTYTITFTDVNGCTGTTTQTITAGPALTATASTTAAACPGVNNGTFTVTAPTGTAPFTYTINATPANTTGATSGAFTGLPGGSYTVTFTAANGCTGTVTGVVVTNTAISLSSSSTGTSTTNASDGTATATPTGGTAPLNYTINATPANTTGATSGIFTGLPAGSYIISVIDANGCTATVPVTVPPGPGLSATTATTAASCPGVNNGSVTVSSPTGIAPHTYTINATPANTTGAASGIFTGLAGGTYTITITDANGTTGVVNATVSTGGAITATSTAVNTTCNNATNGSMTATPTAGSGTAPFSYTINATPANTTGASSGMFTGLAAGTYTITFTDMNGCAGTTTQTISAGPALTATANTTATSCPGVNNGAFEATSPTGTAPFTYTINATPANTTGVASGNFTGLAAGAYIINFTDAAGCTGTVSGTVAAGAGITATSTAVNTSCNNATNGSMTAIPTAGSGTAPFSYTINATPANTTGATSGTFTGLAAGTYIITFTDANGCQGTTTKTITAGPALTATGNTTGTSCPGVNNGAFEATAPTGTAPFTYTINATPANTTGAASGNFTGLAAGAYIISFTDAAGCTGTVSGTVAASAGITATSTSTNTTCNNATNGTMSATPTPGSGTVPFSYTINATPANTTGASSGMFTGLAAGTYTITFTDMNGCVGTTTQTITAGPALTATANTTGTSCPGVNNGAFEATSPTGTAPFTYTINATPANTTGVASGNFTGLAAGAYIISFTDATGCTGTVSGTVAAGAGITGTSASTNTTCNNATNGTMSATLTPGVPFSYTINATPANTTGAISGMFTGLAAGTYTITFTDVNGCVGTTTQTITAGPALTATANTTGTSCPGVNNGAFEATSPTGTASFTYTINATPANTTGAASGNFTGLAAGAYIISFTDAAGCTGTVSGTVAAGAGITATSTSTNTTCNNATNGLMTATPDAGSGTAPFSYTINATPANTTGAISGMFTGLAAGTYTITFTDMNGCVGTTTQTITAGPALTATANTTGTSCPGVNNGVFEATSPTGTGSFTYIINATPANTTGATSGNFTGLAAGAYIISFTDAAGCTGTVSGTVTQGAALTATSIFTNPNCAGVNSGSFSVTPTNGSSTFTYSINAVPANTTGVLTGAFTGLAAGSYIITFTDANGCTGTQTATLTANLPLVTAETHINPTCFGGANGSITFTPTGGVSPYTYALLPSATFQASNIISGLSAGSHTIRVKDNVGCIKDTTIVLTQPIQLTASAVKDNNTTCAGDDGGITVTAGGGTPPYQYSIDNGITYQSTGVFTNATNTTYNGNIKVKDANNCLATANTIIIGQDNDLTLDILASGDTTICQGLGVKLTPMTNAGAGATYVWTSLNPRVPISTVTGPDSLNVTVSPVDTVTYNLTVNYRACSVSDVVTVNVIWKPILDASASPQAICIGDSTLLSGTVRHNSGPVTDFTWTPLDSLTTPDSIITWAHPIRNTWYKLTATTTVADYGCDFTVSDSIKVIIPPTVIAFAGNDTIAVKGVPHQLHGTGGTNYTWSSPSAVINNPFSQNPLTTLNNDANFFLKVENAIGCAAYDTLFVKVYDGPQFYMPNAFTPNGDGLNDILRGIPVGIANTVYFRVFNRYGELMFETNQWLKGWDGTYKGKPQPNGVYVWMVKGVDRNNVTVEKQGTVMLIR